jgi:hypothetical protein
MTSIQCNDAFACAQLGIEPVYVSEDETWAYGWKTTNTLAILDLETASFSEEIELIDGSVEAALARGNLVAITIAQPSRVDDDGRVWVRSMLERIHIDDAGVVRLAPINIPGVAASIDAGGDRAITLDRQYVDRPGWLGSGLELSLVAIDLDQDGASVTSRLRLGDELASLAAGDQRVYAVRSDLTYATEDVWSGWTTPGAHLVAIDVSDRDDLEIAGEQPLGDGWWWIVARTPTTLVLGGGYDGGLALFDVTGDPDEPAFLRYVRTLGWMTSVVQDGDDLYIVGGPYGIQVEPTTEGVIP